jgi:hypothetical protein
MTHRLFIYDHWDRLDRFEGADYERVLTQARDAGGARVDVFAYQLRGRTGRR